MKISTIAPYNPACLQARKNNASFGKFAKDASGYEAERITGRTLCDLYVYPDDMFDYSRGDFLQAAFDTIAKSPIVTVDSSNGNITAALNEKALMKYLTKYHCSHGDLYYKNQFDSMEFENENLSNKSKISRMECFLSALQPELLYLRRYP